MPRAQLRFARGFHVALKNARAQAATMVIALPAYRKDGEPLPRSKK
jgi:hypothetical protein